MIIETSDNRFYRVHETEHVDHVWYGYPVKRVIRWYGYPVKRVIRRHEWVLTAAGQRAFNAKRPELVRKAGSRIVEA